MNSDDPRGWAPRLARVIRESSISIIDRIEILEETPSTQDAAYELAAGTPGLMVLAVRQTAGRGRLGRSWQQSGELGLAATLVLDAAEYPPGQLSLAAGLATARAVDLGSSLLAEFGLRWPNDVVEPLPRPGGGRKLAGILVEVRSGLALVGVGVNVRQRETDFPHELRHAAVSLHQLGSDTSRIEIAMRLVSEMHQVLKLPSGERNRAWARRDVLVGSAQNFRHDGQNFKGVVQSIDPANEIVIRMESTDIVRLPAATTSLIHD